MTSMSHEDGYKAVSRPDNPNQTEAEKLATSIVPYPRDDAKAVYLGLRCSGMTIRESLRLMGYAHSTLSKWRLDSQFTDIENRMPEYQKELSAEYANLEFVRNYRLVLEKDYRVLHKSLFPDKITVKVGEHNQVVDAQLTEQEQAYLLKLRSHYTPQQLQIIQTLMQGNKGQEFDFTSWVIKASRTVEQVTMEGRKTKVLDMSPLPPENNDA